jgi:MscS family membrane protein
MGVEYGTSPKVLEEFALRSKDIINQNSWVAADKTIVHLNGLGASSIDLLVMVYLDVPSYDDELASKHKILLQLIELAEEMNVSFAFPTQTLHLKQ